MAKLRNGALYIRVSTADQTELSPDAQQRLLLDYAKKNGIIINKDFIFVESVSGRHADKRPKFQEMIGIAKQDSHPIDVILVWKYSRFARNQEESIVYKSLLKKSGVDVISISEPLIDGRFRHADRADHRVDGRILLDPIIRRGDPWHERKSIEAWLPVHALSGI